MRCPKKHKKPQFVELSFLFTSVQVITQTEISQNQITLAVLHLPSGSMKVKFLFLSHCWSTRDLRFDCFKIKIEIAHCLSRRQMPNSLKFIARFTSMASVLISTINFEAWRNAPGPSGSLRRWSLAWRFMYQPWFHLRLFDAKNLRCTRARKRLQIIKIKIYLDANWAIKYFFIDLVEVKERFMFCVGATHALLGDRNKNLSAVRICCSSWWLFFIVIVALV